jgi:hypothetical protein
MRRRASSARPRSDGPDVAPLPWDVCAELGDGAGWAGPRMTASRKGAKSCVIGGCAKRDMSGSDGEKSSFFPFAVHSYVVGRKISSSITNEGGGTIGLLGVARTSEFICSSLSLLNMGLRCTR